MKHSGARARGRLVAALAIGLAAAGTGSGAETAGERISFRDAVKRALEQNPNAQVANEEIQRAYGLMEQARSGSLPTLVGTTSHFRYQSKEPNSRQQLIGPEYLSTSGVVTVPLLAPQRWVAWAHAEDSIDVATANAADVRRLVALAAGRAYLSVFAAQRVLEAAVQARDTAKAHHEFTMARAQGGVGRELDEVRADQELEADEARVENARAALAVSQEALSVLIGAPEPVEVVEVTEPDLGPAPTLADALDESPRRRTDVTLARERMAAAQHQVRDDWADYMPSLMGSASSFFYDPQLTPLYPHKGWYVGLGLSLPFFEGGLRVGQATERSALLAEAESALTGVLLQARSDVRASYEIMQRADDALGALHKAEELARRSLDLADLAYKNGAVTNLEVVDAERNARDAEISAALGEDAARQARLALLSAVGRFP